MANAPRPYKLAIHDAWYMVTVTAAAEESGMLGGDGHDKGTPAVWQRLTRQKYTLPSPLNRNMDKPIRAVKGIFYQNSTWESVQFSMSPM